MADLAIILLAYRSDYLQQVMHSLFNQSDRSFNLYIFDDGGKPEIRQIVTAWSDRIPFTYHRFEENMGQYDLAGHWTRCIRTTQGEPWIWLFSDDDLMHPSCVEVFQRYALENGLDERNVYRFPMEMIDSDNNIMASSGEWPVQLRHGEYLRQRLEFRLLSSVNEFIFSRTAFDREGFQSWPLAWCSDDAAWISFTGGGCIHTLPGGRVGWRSSSINISSDTSKINGKRRLVASLNYLSWLNDRALVDPELRVPQKLKLSWLTVHWMMLRRKNRLAPPAYGFRLLREKLDLYALTFVVSQAAGLSIRRAISRNAG